MVRLCGRAGRLTAQNGGFRPGQICEMIGAADPARGMSADDFVKFHAHYVASHVDAHLESLWEWGQAEADMVAFVKND